LEKRISFPYLKAAARELGITATSAPSERVKAMQANYTARSMPLLA